jgi:hypothetical protein
MTPSALSVGESACPRHPVHVYQRIARERLVRVWPKQATAPLCEDVFLRYARLKLESAHTPENDKSGQCDTL